MIRTLEECEDYIRAHALVPFMRDERLPSLETLAPGNWWTGEPGDPWAWRKEIAVNPEFVYAKFVGGKAGLATREAYTLLCAVRQGGMDFDEYYALGTVPRRQKRVVETLRALGALPTHRLKREAGFGKGGEKGFEGALAALQTRCYVRIIGYERKRDRFGMEYGWDSTVYALVDEELPAPEEAYAALFTQMQSASPDIAGEALASFIQG